MDTGLLLCMGELVVGEELFLFSCPKRKGFVYRIIISLIVLFLASAFYPMPLEIKYTWWYSLLRFLCLFLVSLAANYFIYDISFSAVLSLSGAGYALQHLAYQITSAIALTGLLQGAGENRRMILEGIFFPFVYAFGYFVFARSGRKEFQYKNVDYRFDMLTLMILAICLGLSRLTRSSTDEKVILSTSFYSITCCILALIIQFSLRRNMKLREENVAIRRMWEEDKKHYEISKENMELISIKAHDLKHKILSYSSSLPEEELAQMKKTIDEYDNFFHTGNDAIDVILSEKGMRCEKEKIALTFLGDGKILSFMNAMDIYSLLGNAIDNSIEALKHVEEVEKRIISINLENKGDITNLTIRNYFDGELQLDEDGLPFTSKQYEKGYHGYGMKSMRLIARKYSGNLSIRISGNIFVVNIYLMR